MYHTRHNLSSVYLKCHDLARVTRIFHTPRQVMLRTKLTVLANVGAFWALDDANSESNNSVSRTNV